ncbi:unnamed protein product [Polarella glacialis]|uniref:Uncharacterized protein n=1 Tax=Polarella glacialis TaxID=89957 RepID=A0A813FVA7_POLGL|nr:unnamed protein product [Polarella glacialis]
MVSFATCRRHSLKAAAHSATRLLRDCSRRQQPGFVGQSQSPVQSLLRHSPAVCTRHCSNGGGGESGKLEHQSPKTGRWDLWCDHWNAVLSRRPLATVVFWNASCTLTWASVFGALSSSPTATALLASPDYAVGWLLMRATVKFRQPVNLGLAAVVSKLLPGLSMMKVSPLLAFVTPDAESRNALTSLRRWAFRLPFLGAGGRRLLRRFLRRSSDFVSWAQGPIDRYGLSYFLAAKVTSLTTLCGGTIAAMQGLDVSASLTWLGLSSELQKDAGLFACAAALNVPLAPLHFYGSVSWIC